MLRIGIVGSGFMGTTHAAAWANTPAQLVGICSVDQKKAQKLADQYHARTYSTYADLLRAVDVIDICTPTHLHHPMVLEAASVGKHIVCEKPLARTAQQGREMIAACERAGVKLLIAHVVRFSPSYVQAKLAVDRGDIGSPAVLRLTRCGFKPGWASDDWLADEARSGGMMLDLMIHDFDYARWVAGDVASVFARNVHSRTPNAPEDYAIAILKHRGGAISNIEGGWAYPPPLFRTGLEIAGDAGLIEMPPDSTDPLSLHLKETGKSDTEDVMLATSPLSEDPYTTQIRHFNDVLTGSNTQPRVTAQDGLAALEIALAAIESARTGRQVNVGGVK
jgi:myo-inositol 2-dehydrogenase / D-chiro-inositol 1-dehydrogenase